MLGLSLPIRQTVLFSYPTVAAGREYIRPLVKIELGARSDIDPAETPSITPYVPVPLGQTIDSDAETATEGERQRADGAQGRARTTSSRWT
jgi:hypothetical protein